MEHRKLLKGFLLRRTINGVGIRERLKEALLKVKKITSRSIKSFVGLNLRVMGKENFFKKEKKQDNDEH